jgi:hypothetical protein
MKTLNKQALTLLEQFGPEKVMAVTKYFGREEIIACLEAGFKHIGENRLQDLQEKLDEQLKECFQKHTARLHYLGTLQSNKLSKIFDLSSQIDSLFELRKAEKLNQLATDSGQPFPVLIQLNMTGEQQKQGLLLPEGAEQKPLQNFLQEMKAFTHLDVRGFMLMGALGDPDSTRQIYRRAKELQEQFELPELSMGMSQDYRIALEEGATMVRVGRMLFEG